MGNRVLKEKRLGIAMLAVTLAALLLITACAPGPPVEEKRVVKVGLIAPFTGAAAAPCQFGLRNTIDYLRYFEEEGIPGVTLQPGVAIELSWADDAYDVSRAVGAYERFIDRGVVLLHIYNSAAAEALKPRLEKDEVPGIVMAVTAASMYPPGWLYAFYPTASESFAVVAHWIMENWEEERPPRLAFMGIDTVYGRECEVTGAKYAESIGIEMAPMEIVPVMPLDTFPQLLRLDERKVDFVYLTCAWLTAIPVMKDAERLGVTDKIRFGGYEITQVRTLIETIGPAAEGYFAPRAYPWYKEVPFFTDMTMRYRGEIDTQGDGAGTLAFMSAMIEAIRIAIEGVGYENLDGHAVKEAMYGIKDFDPHGIGKKITYTPKDHRGSATIIIHQVQGGEAVPVSEWRDAPMLVPEK